MKTCTGCSLSKPTDQFWRNKKTRDGYTHKCKVCMRAAASPEAAKRNKRNHYLRHKETYKERAKLWAASNPSRVREVKRNSQKHSLEKRAANENRRRARKKGNGASPYSRKQVIERDGGQCKLCNLPVDLSLSWPDVLSPSIDHRIPLSKGGPDTFENVQLAHLGCNIKKGGEYDS